MSHTKSLILILVIWCWACGDAGPWYVSAVVGSGTDSETDTGDGEACPDPPYRCMSVGTCASNDGVVMAMYDCVHDPFVCCDLGVDTGTETETASETETETETETVTETASDTDTVTETETETETETVSDTDTGTDTGTGTEPQCPGWLDVVAGLCWEDQPAASPMTYEWGGERCEDVSAEYGGEWRLPLIQELRSLIQGCVTVDCGVTDPSCLSNSCLSGPLCIPCSFMDGPGPDGCYWDPELDGPCEWYWSASPGNNPAYGWGVKFQYAEIAGKLRSQELYVRCVRNWP